MECKRTKQKIKLKHKRNFLLQWFQEMPYIKIAFLYVIGVLLTDCILDVYSVQTDIWQIGFYMGLCLCIIAVCFYLIVYIYYFINKTIAIYHSTKLPFTENELNNMSFKNAEDCITFLTRYISYKKFDGTIAYIKLSYDTIAKLAILILDSFPDSCAILCEECDDNMKDNDTFPHLKVLIALGLRHREMEKRR